MTRPPPIMKDVILVGAGHAHVGVLRRVGMEPLPGVRFTLITRQVETPYSGMLPGVIAGVYRPDEMHIDTAPLCRFAGARLFIDEVTGIDPEQRRVICATRPPVPYDVLSLDIGSVPNTQAVRGAEAAIPVKPIDSFLTRFDALRKRVLATDRTVRIGVVGAGAGGVELLLSVERRLRHEASNQGRLQFFLISATEEILPDFPRAMQERALALLRARGVEILTGAPVTGVKNGALLFENRPSRALDEILWTTQATAAGWLKASGLALDKEGFVRVRPTLESVSHPGIFAVGDVASVDGFTLPKSGVYAVRQGPVLEGNIRRLLTSNPLVDYHPQRHTLALLTTGERRAFGGRNGITVGGRWVWHLKDWIDRGFMRKFRDLPAMEPPRSTDVDSLGVASAQSMRCGGCGAKIGAPILARVLDGLQPAERADVVIGLSAPDDAAAVDTGGLKLSLHTIDHFRDMIDDPYLLGKIAANHALGDIYAMGGEPQTALAFASLPHASEAVIEADLAMMMVGANEVFSRVGCALVGGHTSEGAELSLGFAVNGLVAREALMRKGGLQPGDALILTKPIGTGILLAARMQGKARGIWIAEAIAGMIRSSSQAAEIMRFHGAHAMTDVTGFGLIGHLAEMVRASEVDVTLLPRFIPLLDGTREMLDRGIVSSLQPQNLKAAAVIRNAAGAARHPLYPVLFDPQTAGGLLAGLPNARSRACLADLHAAGYADAAVIGSCHKRSAAPEPVVLYGLLEEERSSRGGSVIGKERVPS